MHFIDVQYTDGQCRNLYYGSDYKEADVLYRRSIDSAGESVSNISWYFNRGNDQQHLGTRIFRPIH